MPKEFDNAILQISDKIKRTLQFIPDDIKHDCEEIRLRIKKPVCLTIGGNVMFVCKNSAVSTVLPPDPLIATKEIINESLALLCNNSVYLHENEIKQGFVSLTDGNRAGVCGVFNAEGMLVSVSSINIRIARQIFDCAKNILPYATDGLLVAGPPGSGKTTILRDLIRLLSNGEGGRYYRVAVIDSRREISGGGKLDTGVNTDIFYTTDKSIGAQMAIRTMFPNFIAFDEIGTTAELDSIKVCFNAGVGIITTTHCKCKEDLFRRQIPRDIIKCGAIKYVALLEENTHKKIQILTSQEIQKYVFS